MRGVLEICVLYFTTVQAYGKKITLLNEQNRALSLIGRQYFSHLTAEKWLCKYNHAYFKNNVDILLTTDKYHSC